MFSKNSKIFVAGHKGLVGSSVMRRLRHHGFKNIITANKKSLDLTDQSKTFKFLKKKKPKFLIICAARVGGILADNTYKGEFAYDNLQIQNNLIHGAYINGIKNLIFLGSSCVYPRNCKQPIKENYLLSGSLEKTNESYAIAKIAGIKLCESYNFQYKTNFLCLMPTNTYGPNDNYNPFSSHFMAAIIRKAHEIKLNNKKTINIWGTGKVKREVIYVDDIADACIFFLNKKTRHSVINIGSGKEKKIIDYVNFLIKKIKTNARIHHDLSQNDGTPRKILDNSLAKKYGWESKISLDKGFEVTYSDFLKTNLKK